MSTLLPRALASLALLLAAPAAVAQVATPPEATTPTPPAGQPDGSDGGAASADPCAGQPGPGASEGSLTGQLRNCGGVLTPPDTGASGMEVPAPDPEPGTTPVIPPGQVPNQAPNGNGGNG